jgi:DNA-binding NarL/FixJ family response regulator
MKPIRVVLADDHALVRAGIRSLLEKLAGVEVVAEAGDAREALAALDRHRPQVVILDLSMPGLNGLEGTVRAVRDYPQVRILILSMHADEEHVLQALRAGATGYLVKDAVPTELELAIRAVACGDTYLSPAVAKHVVAARVPPGSRMTDPLDRLTPRLREILQLIGEGHTTKEIAHILKTSPKTIENHRARLRKRLGVRDLAGLIRCALQLGLVSPR